jgi:glycosyltransferase involved in cell wall biosynthesis
VLPAAYHARRAGIPYVIRPLGALNRWGMTRRRPWLKRVSFRLLERRILRGAASIHYTSEQEKAEAADLGVHGRSAVIPLGVDLAPFENLPPRGWLRRRWPELARRPLVLFLSRVDPKKGLDLLFRALAGATRRQPDIALVVAGSGEPAFEAKLRREATRLGLNGSVFWTGFLSDSDKLTALADADLFVLPSYSENFGVAAVEAMAAGLPVVVSDRVAIHREVAAAGAGLVVPCESDAVTAAVLRLVGDRSLAAELGARGRRLAWSHFSLASMVAGLMASYEEALRASDTVLRTSRQHR